MLLDPCSGSNSHCLHSTMPLVTSSNRCCRRYEVSSNGLVSQFWELMIKVLRKVASADGRPSWTLTLGTETTMIEQVYFAMKRERVICKQSLLLGTHNGAEIR